MGVGVRDGVEDRVRVRAWVRDKFRVRVRGRVRVRARVRARVRVGFSSVARQLPLSVPEDLPWLLAREEHGDRVARR